MEVISLINQLLQKEYGLDAHGKKYNGTIGNRKIIWKLMLAPENKAQDTKRKHETNCGKVEDDTPVATLEISENEVNRRTKTTTKTMTKMKTTKTEMNNKGVDVAMRTK